MKRKTYNYENLKRNIKTREEADKLAEVLMMPYNELDRVHDMLSLFCSMYTEEAGTLQTLSNAAKYTPNIVRSFTETIFCTVSEALAMISECYHYMENGEEEQA